MKFLGFLNIKLVCGANYFLTEYLYSSKSCYLLWVKNNPAPNFAQAELVYGHLQM